MRTLNAVEQSVMADIHITAGCDACVYLSRHALSLKRRFVLQQAKLTQLLLRSSCKLSTEPAPGDDSLKSVDHEDMEQTTDDNVREVNVVERTSDLRDRNEALERWDVERHFLHNHIAQLEHSLSAMSQSNDESASQYCKWKHETASQHRRDDDKNRCDKEGDQQRSGPRTLWNELDEAVRENYVWCVEKLLLLLISCAERLEGIVIGLNGVDGYEDEDKLGLDLTGYAKNFSLNVFERDFRIAKRRLENATDRVFEMFCPMSEKINNAEAMFNRALNESDSKVAALSAKLDDNETELEEIRRAHCRSLVQILNRLTAGEDTEACRQDDFAWLSEKIASRVCELIDRSEDREKVIASSCSALTMIEDMQANQTVAVNTPEMIEIFLSELTRDIGEYNLGGTQTLENLVILNETLGRTMRELLIRSRRGEGLKRGNEAVAGEQEGQTNIITTKRKKVPPKMITND
jgi:hypothetical protein